MLVGQVGKLHQNFNDFHYFRRCFLEGGIWQCEVDTSTVVALCIMSQSQFTFKWSLLKQFFFFAFCSRAKTQSISVGQKVQY